MMCSIEQQLPGAWCQQGTHQPPLKVNLPLISFPLWQLMCSPPARPPSKKRRSAAAQHSFSTISQSSSIYFNTSPWNSVLE